MAEPKKPQPTKQPQKQPEKAQAEKKQQSSEGWSLATQMEKLQMPSKKWLWIIGGVVIAAIVIVIIVVAVVSNTTEPTGLVPTSAIADTSTTEAPETTTTTMAETVSDGTYLVGTDIPAGLYKGTVNGGGAFWQISNDANGQDVVAREDVSAQFYLEAEEGQFLKLFNVTISQ